jgi:hypothetical protein
MCVRGAGTDKGRCGAYTACKQKMQKGNEGGGEGSRVGLLDFCYH